MLSGCLGRSELAAFNAGLLALQLRGVEGAFDTLYFAADMACHFDTRRDTLLVSCWLPGFARLACFTMIRCGLRGLVVFRFVGVQGQRGI